MDEGGPVDIHEHLKSLSEGKCRDALVKLLAGYLNPAFGTLPKREIDLLFYEVLDDLGIVDKDPTIYSLVQRLRVTRSKARGLLYDIELRRLDAAMLDERVREALKSPVIQKQGDLFALEIENPLELDHVRAIIQNLGHASDGSFSPSLVKLSPVAFAALMEHFLSEQERKALKAALVKAGCAADTSLRAMLTGVLKKVASKVASDAGEALAEQVGDYLGPFVDGAVDNAFAVASSLFKKEETV